MKISICIQQYNRINYLLRSLSIIENQSYPDIEISISDDCSTDNTAEKIRELIRTYKYPIVFHQNEKNEGYDRTYRKCIEISTGDYALVIGNDDSINGHESIQKLVNFLNTLGNLNHLVTVDSVNFIKPADAALLLSVNGKVYYLDNN